MWVASADAELVYKVDPVSNAVLLTLPVYMVDPDGSLGVGHGSLWVSYGVRQWFGLFFSC